MEKQVTTTVACCDQCGSTAYRKCDGGCGKDLCTSDKCHRVYQHAVYFSGSDDGNYCDECMEKPADARRLAYETIGRLRDEHTAFHDDFRLRMEAAEARVKQLRNS